MKLKHKKRIVLELDSDAVEALDELKMYTGHKTRTSLVRQALSLLHLAEDMKRDGYSLKFTKGEETREIIGYM